MADGLAATDGHVRVLHRPVKEGRGGAYVEGYGLALAAGAGLLCQLDADLSHAPRDLRRLIAAAIAGADVVIGSRHIANGATAAGWSPLRKAISRGAGRYARSLLGLTVSDPTSGFRCYRAAALRELDLETVVTLAERDGHLGDAQAGLAERGGSARPERRSREPSPDGRRCPRASASRPSGGSRPGAAP